MDTMMQKRVPHRIARTFSVGWADRKQGVKKLGRQPTASGTQRLRKAVTTDGG